MPLDDEDAEANSEGPLEVEPVPGPDPWGGLPPPGERPIVDKWHFTLEVLGVFGLWLVLWAGFRVITVELVQASEIVSAILSIIAAPTITLIPPILWWRYRLRERGLPYLFTSRNLFTSILIACLAVVIFFVLMNLSYPVLIKAMGIEVEGELQFVAAWRGMGIDWLVSVTFLYMFIVGPVEELFHRGFIQDQINRCHRPWFGIFIASIVFVLGHVPIDFMVYHVTWLEWGVRWLSSFPFAIAMGAMYHWSRNIWGVAVYHGLYDWFLGIAYLEFGTGEGIALTGGQLLTIIGIWSAMELLIILALSYAGYRLWWKGDRPAGSLGFRISGISYGVRPDGLLASARRVLKRRWVVRWATRVDRYPVTGREMWSIAVVGIVIFGTLGFSGALGVVPLAAGGAGEGADWDSNVPVKTTNHVEDEYGYERSERDFGYKQNVELTYVSINATLTWTDEPPDSPRFDNEPDTFSVEVFVDDGFDFSPVGRASGTTGRVEVSWKAEGPMVGYGVYVTVETGDCGDQVPLVSVIDGRTRADNGNAFRLEVEISVVGIE